MAELFLNVKTEKIPSAHPKPFIQVIRESVPEYIPKRGIKIDWIDTLKFTEGINVSIELAMDQFGKEVVAYIKRSMQPGHYKLWRSKRPQARAFQEKFNIVEEKKIFSVTTETVRKLKSGATSVIRSTKNKSGALWHWSSEPPKPPAPDTTALKKSLRYRVYVVGGGRRRLEIMAGTPYARILELGGIAGNGARIAPRPYIRPAVEIFKPRFAKLVAQYYQYKGAEKGLQVGTYFVQTRESGL